jgi:hypothetical protein
MSRPCRSEMCLHSYQHIHTDCIGVGPVKACETSRRHLHLVKLILLNLLPVYQFERCHTSRHLILKRLDTLLLPSL